MTAAQVGILSAATYLPPRTRTLDDILTEEGIRLDASVRSRLGVRQVHVFEGESPTDMAVEVSRLALEKAGLEPTGLDAIIDFSVMPQKYVEPAWSMSNELQALLGAKNAFTLGFSGGGSANIHVALKFATALIRANDDVSTILLVASDCAIPGNRIINQDDPLTVIGDAASAIILQRGAKKRVIVDSAASSDGRLHDVINIPGGGIAHPTWVEQYKLVIDRNKLGNGDPNKALKSLCADMLRRHALEIEGITHTLTPNISTDDIRNSSVVLKNNQTISATNMAILGHTHSNDLVFNLLELESTGLTRGDYILLASHGLGFTTGATLVKY